jgi:hypothetical protein
MARDDVLVERNGPVTTVIINRPEARNACRVETVKALHDAIDNKTMVLEYRFAKGDSEPLPKRARESVDGQPRSFVIRIVPRRTCRGDTVHDRDRTPTVAESK